MILISVLSHFLLGLESCETHTALTTKSEQSYRKRPQKTTMGISSADKKRRRTEAGGGGGSAFVVPHSVEVEEQEKVLQDLAPRPAAVPARIRHELFHATADDDFYEGPRIPAGFNAPGAAAAFRPRQQPHHDVGKKRPRK
jgi:hypothetical protein